MDLSVLLILGGLAFVFIYFTKEEIESKKRWRECEEKIRERQEKKELESLYHKMEIIPPEMQDSKLRNSIYKQYFDFEYPETVLKKYRNHCWECGRSIDSRENLRCPKCEWYICKCGSCRSNCGYGHTYKLIYDDDIRRMDKLSETYIIKNRFVRMKGIKKKQGEYLLSHPQRPLEKKAFLDLNAMVTNEDWILDKEEQKKLREELTILEKLEEKKTYLREIKCRFDMNVFFENMDEEMKYLEEIEQKEAESKIEDEVEKERKRKAAEEEERLRKYRLSFRYVYDRMLATDKKIISFSEHPHRVELSINVSSLSEHEVENYIKSLLEKVKDFVMELTLFVDGEKKKKIIKGIKSERIQYCTSYANRPNVVILLVSAKKKDNNINLHATAGNAKEQTNVKERDEK